MAAPKNALATLTAKELARFETLALGLKNDGYNSAVVCRKMISQYEMDEAAATQLVSRLYGKQVDPRKGDTTFAVASGLVAAATTGTIGGGALYFLGSTRAAWYIAVPFLTLAGGALARVIIALVNADVKEDLRDPPHHD